MLETDYDRHVDDVVANVTNRAIKGDPPSLDDLMGQLVPDHPATDKVRNLLPLLKVTPVQFDRALAKRRKQADAETRQAEKLEAVRNALGGVPETVQEFVALHAGARNLTLCYNGTFAGIPDMTVPSWKRDLRLLRSELGLIQFKDSHIDDAVDLYGDEVRAIRRAAIKDLIEKLPEGGAPDMRERLVELCRLLAPTMDPAMVADVLRKFAWQVKRKLSGLDIADPLMPVLVGPQGVGKSLLMDKLAEPLNEVSCDASLADLSDNRRIGMWSNYVIKLDEMAKAEKADVETIKHVLTAKVLTRRVFNTQNDVAVAQRATMIGASNMPLAEVVRDPTGMRRFAEIQFAGKDGTEARVQAILGFDWLAMWQFVDKDGADPMAPWRTELAAHRRQAGRSRRSRSGWRPTRPTTAPAGSTSGLMVGSRRPQRTRSASSSSTGPSTWPNYTKISITSFGRQMGSLLDKFGVTKRLDNRGTSYIWPPAVA